MLQKRKLDVETPILKWTISAIFLMIPIQNMLFLL